MSQCLRRALSDSDLDKVERKEVSLFVTSPVRNSKTATGKKTSTSSPRPFVWKRKTNWKKRGRFRCHPPLHVERRVHSSLHNIRYLLAHKSKEVSFIRALVEQEKTLLDQGTLLDAVNKIFKKAALMKRDVEILDSECKQRFRENQNMKEQIKLLEYRLCSANRELEDRHKLWVRKKSLENTVNTMKMDNQRLRSDLHEEERKYSELWRRIELCGLVDILFSSWRHDDEEIFLDDFINEDDVSVIEHNSGTYASAGWDVSYTDDSHLSDLQIKQYHPAENWEKNERSSTKWQSENEAKLQISSCTNNKSVGKGYPESAEISKRGDSNVTFLVQKTPLESTDTETGWWDDVWGEGDQSLVTSGNEVKVTPWTKMHTDMPKQDGNDMLDKAELKASNADFQQNGEAEESCSSSLSSKASSVSAATESECWDDSSKAKNKSSDIAVQQLKVTLCAEENDLQKQGGNSMSQSNGDRLPQNGREHELHTSLNNRTTVAFTEMRCGCCNDSSATQNERWETFDHEFKAVTGSEMSNNSQKQHDDSNFSNCNIASDEDYLKLHSSSNARAHLMVGETENGRSGDSSTLKDKTLTVDDQDLKVLQETEMGIDFQKQEENISNLDVSDFNFINYQEYQKSNSSLWNCKHHVVTTEQEGRPCYDSSVEKNRSSEVTNQESRCRLGAERETESYSCFEKQKASHISDLNVSDSSTSNYEVCLKLNSCLSNDKLRLATRTQEDNGCDNSRGKNDRPLDVPDEELEVLSDAERGCSFRKQEQNTSSANHSNLPSCEAYWKLCSSLSGEKDELSSTAKESCKRDDSYEGKKKNLEITDQELKFSRATKIVTDFQNQDANCEMNTSDSTVDHSNMTNYEEHNRKLHSSLFTGKSQMVVTAIKSELCDDSDKKNNGVLEVSEQELKVSQDDESDRSFQKQKSRAVTERNGGNSNLQNNEEHLKLQNFLLLNGNTRSSEDGTAESSDLPIRHEFRVMLRTGTDLADQKLANGNLLCHSGADNDSDPPHHDIRDIRDSTLN